MHGSATATAVRGLRASLAEGANPLNSDQFCQQTYLGGSWDRLNNRCMLHTFVRLFLYTQADRVCDLDALTCMWPLGEPRRYFTAKQEAQKLVVVAPGRSIIGSATGPSGR